MSVPSLAGVPMRMGVEIEFGMAGGWTIEAAMAIQHAIERQPHLAHVREGVFLRNGARVYVDQGLHNEYASPEVDSPGDLVVHELAGRRLMQTAAAGTGRALLCANVAPHNRATWGTHENYACNEEPAAVRLAFLNTHLVTRIVFAGAGGLDPFAGRPRPVYSPRACFIRADLCRQGTQRKSLVFVKPHHHGAGYRLHVFCGESLLSPRASFLKYATTALVAWCLDHGFTIGPGPLAGPAVRALRQVNRDLDLSRPLLFADGRRMNALEVQRALFESVVACRPDLPAWASLALVRWDATLTELERRSSEVGTSLDWAIFHRAFAQIETELEGRGGTGPAELCAQGHALYLRLRTLGENSLFDAWKRAGHLDTDLPEVTEEAVATAEVTPPPGRAAVRASLIRRHADLSRLRADWGHAEAAHGAEVTIPDEPSEDWDQPLRTPSPLVCADRLAGPVGGDFCELYRSGAYAELVREYADSPLLRSSSQARVFLRDYALALARLGRDGEARELLTGLRGSARRRDTVADLVFATVHFGLAPPVDALTPLIEEGDRLLASQPHTDYERLLFLQGKARWLCAQRRYGEAIGICCEVLDARAQSGLPRLLTRMRCCLAEALRCSGQVDVARNLMFEICATCECEELRGDFLDHAVPLALKLLPEFDAAVLLDVVRNAIGGEGYGLRRARVLAVAARRLGLEYLEPEWRSAIATVPCLARCRVTHQIARAWPAWAMGLEDGTRDDYWGVA